MRNESGRSITSALRQKNSVESHTNASRPSTHAAKSGRSSASTATTAP